ncbi:hypothetical protein JDN40_16160 [Rhodomicrobium vannielii ATCC 17100]|uniref:hypothetical protein n=1 Tax=Rhodomicrobium vannielii TaxID=1069 RepID=UPI0019198A00|nr:hypothetical protein [Rhodomicrobium vannielii]MBJ7535643.1 hypothetical protein [Rhodomicrobium vannielii ATCC 17100]
MSAPSQACWRELHYRLIRPFRLDKFIEAYQHVSGFNSTVTTLHDVNIAANVGLFKSDFVQLKENLSILVDLLNEHGLSLSAMSAKTALDLTVATDGDLLGDPNLKGKMVFDRAVLIPWKAAIKDLQGRVRDEFKSRYLLVVPPEKVQFYAPHKPLFGSNLATQFPSVLFEIDEAAKCFALGRYTATVFHLMRALEIALEAVRLCLGQTQELKPADRNWGTMLRNINNELDRRSKRIPPLWNRTTDKAFFEEFYVTLDRIRGLWRNSTMHIEVKYTEEEARDIFDAVKTLMKKISSRMDENGLPIA